MAEITPGRARAAKEILIFEDFESVTHHAQTSGSTGTRVRRSADAAHRGHAGLEFFTPAADGATATAIWTTRSSKQPLMSISFWCKAPASIPAGYLEAYLTIQKAYTKHEIGIRFNFSTQGWEFLNESRAWVSLPEVTAVISQDIWTRIIIEINTQTGRVIAIHVSEQSFRINRVYTKNEGQFVVTFTNVEIRVNGSAALAITLYIDDLIVQEL
jgi:hypothetical protein